MTDAQKNFSEHTIALPMGFRVHWYALERILGQGSFGITYLALDTNLNSRVALKEFLPSQLATRVADSTVRPLTHQHEAVYEWGLERFIQEAQTLARFRHPNIVLVHSVFEANNTAYMVMEFRAGQSLAESFAAGKLTAEPELKKILAALLDGLDRVHAAGFIHRDVKPSNVVCDDRLRPTLLDFGSARQALSFETHTLTSLVSPGYAPFEQYSDTPGSEREGPWTDIYALAATIYTGIAGIPPIDAASRVSALVRGDPDPYAPAVEIGKDRYSPEFLAAIDRALSFHIEDRPQSVTQWREILLACDPVFEPRDAADYDREAESAPPDGRTPQARDVPGAGEADEDGDELEEITFDEDDTDTGEQPTLGPGSVRWPPEEPYQEGLTQDTRTWRLSVDGLDHPADALAASSEDEHSGAVPSPPDAESDVPTLNVAAPFADATRRSTRSTGRRSSSRHGAKARRRRWVVPASVAAALVVFLLPLALVMYSEREPAPESGAAAAPLVRGDFPGSVESGSVTELAPGGAPGAGPRRPSDDAPMHAPEVRRAAVGLGSGPRPAPPPGEIVDADRVAVMVEEARIGETKRRQAVEAQLLALKREQIERSRASVEESRRKLQAEIARMRHMRAQREAELRRLKSAQSQRAAPYSERIAKLEQQIEQLLTKYVDGHPDVVSARRRLDELRARQAAEMAADPEETATPKPAD